MIEEQGVPPVRTRFLLFLVVGVCAVTVPLGCGSPPLDDNAATAPAANEGSVVEEPEFAPGAAGGTEAGMPQGDAEARPSAADAGGFVGIGEDLPAGSAAIDTAGLVAAYDMETRTPDG